MWPGRDFLLLLDEFADARDTARFRPLMMMLVSDIGSKVEIEGGAVA